MKVAIQLVVWNGEKYIAKLFASLRAQTFTDWELLIIDNGSIDNTVRYVESEIRNSVQPVRIILKASNTGFAAPHQELFNIAASDYVLVLNQDVLLEPQTVGRLVAFLDSHAQTGSVSPRLLRLEQNQKTNIVDSLGFKITRSRQIIELGAGQPATESTTPATPVFGVSAVAALYRRSAVVQAGGLFDPAYFAYKEDVDIAWRLQLAGYEAAIVSAATAFHQRSGRPANSSGQAAAVQNKKEQSALVRYHSYKNHLLLLKTCEQWQNALIDFPWIAWYELRKFIYFLCFDRATLRGLGELWHNRKSLRLCRRQIQQGTKVSWRQMRHWWN